VIKITFLTTAQQRSDS